MNDFAEGFATGYACLSARAELLDLINVFPVADSDTGANLRISLSPLRAGVTDKTAVAAQLARCATGNSGNIAASFFCEFLQAETVEDLAATAMKGRANAWQAVATPKEGTMLSVFDCLAARLAVVPVTVAGCSEIIGSLREAVLATAQTLPDLRQAGVVDSGALAMFVFFDGFFRAITGYTGDNRTLAELFPGKLRVAEDFSQEPTDSYCVDAIVRPAADRPLSQETVAALGESVVMIADQAQVKIHIHTTDPDQLRRQLNSLGEVVAWADESIDANRGGGRGNCAPSGCLHIMTDAAGSLTRDLAKALNITLLDSYVVTGDTARPESLCSPEKIYAQMLAGHKVTTAQASLVERHQLYRTVCEQFGRTLYLSVGSAFTGNYATAVAWKEQQDSANLLEIIDSGAASGRLGLIALLVGRYALVAGCADEVISYARSLSERCREYVFIDRLRYLVAGGRVSRANGFFGDLLHMKPVISPMREGVRKVGVVRNRQAQVTFALERLQTELDGTDSSCILLQYSDNKEWVAEVVQTQVHELQPRAEILLVPLSLTSGVHMGPGTWSLAFVEVR
jgi:DegV family protein with EDD domain